MQSLRMASAADIPLSALEDWGPAVEPVGVEEGAPLAHVYARHMLNQPDGVSVGTWECTPGRWRRKVMKPEFAHFVAGRGHFHPDRGASFDINAGDAIYFPANTHGTWEVVETLRKTYVIINAPMTLREHVETAVRGLLGRFGTRDTKAGGLSGAPAATRESRA